MNRITINGVTYEGAGSISIVNGTVTINGRTQPGFVQGVVEVRVLGGSIGTLNTDASVNCQQVTGDIRAGGSVSCDGVGGNVMAGGSVNCDAVRGSVSAGGSIRRG